MNQFSKAIKAGVTAWKVRRDWFGDGGIPVAPELAQQRANVCLKCPFNQEKPVWELLTSAASFAIRQQLKLKTDLALRVNGEEDLHTCAVCLCLLTLKVHVPLKSILESSNPEGLPSFCWQIKEQQNLQHDQQINRIHD